jgi:hypothetical protein
MFLSHCITGMVYIQTVVNIVKIDNTDIVSMMVIGKFSVFSSTVWGSKKKSISGLRTAFC